MRNAKELSWVVLALSIMLAPFKTFATASPSPPSFIAAQIENAQEVGSGRMHYLLWDLYDAVLYAPGGTFRAEEPAALSLTYLRDLDGGKIADKSIELMRAQGPLDEMTAQAWRQDMAAIFPDVHRGTNLTGVLDGKGGTIFYSNGRKIGAIGDPAFGARFFAIWLGPQTTAPDLRAALLGLNDGKDGNR